ncbi:MAG TPA: 4Fe-4S binding protein, partial [Planctomycetes bacterium]|nr:4Fe-4S binding protein [Planctomycetota bacterium]
MVSLSTFAARLVGPKRPEPSYPRLPEVDAQGQTTVPGLYAIGEIAGVPLVKYGLNAGHELVERLAGELRDLGPAPDGVLDLLIIGAGPAGLGAASAARDYRLSAVVLEANHLAETVYTMTKGKVIFAEPEGVEKKGRMWFEECTKEQLLETWTRQVQEFGLDVRTFEKVEDIQREGEHLRVVSTKGTYLARRVVLASGKAGNPRKAGVPGELEYAAKIDHRLIDPDLFEGKDILVYGGGDVALEAALALCDTNRVTLVTIDPEFIYPKRRNIEAVEAKVAEGKIDLHFSSFLEEVGEHDVTFAKGSPGGERVTIPNDHLFEMIGAELPFAFFRKVGIRIANTWTAGRWFALALVFLAVYSLYSLKSYGKGAAGWPWQNWISPEAYNSTLRGIFEVAFLPLRGFFRDDAYRDILADHGYQQGYLYSLLYTIVMVVFGWQALVRWRSVARDKRYQTYRYLSLIGFQVAFFLIVNVIAVEALSVKYAWRAWGLYQPFPLFFNVFFWWYDSDPAAIKWFFIVAGLVGTFGIIPLLARFHGKRFCTWVCGCGGLAETLGDRWRHLAAKGSRSRAWEFQGALILATAAIVGLVVVGVYHTDGNNPWWRTYNYLVDFWLVAVIPVALYPFFGGKVWCRYWCPLAAWNQILARWFGKLKIRSNSHCISCTQCSKYCQVGVDVMSFAKNEASFDNRNSACIQCGICIDVCPMNVLSFDSSPS